MLACHQESEDLHRAKGSTFLRVQWHGDLLNVRTTQPELPILPKAVRDCRKKVTVGLLSRNDAMCTKIKRCEPE